MCSNQSTNKMAANDGQIKLKIHDVQMILYVYWQGLRSICYVQIVFGCYFANNVGGVTI